MPDQARGLGVVAHRVDVAPGGRLAQHEPRDAGTARASAPCRRRRCVPPTRNVSPSARHQRRQVGDGLRVRVQLRDRERDVERAQRDDERRQPDARDQQAVDAARTASSRRCRTAMASGAGTPHARPRACVITMPPSAITMPHDRSMPAVRMISVWPMAITPTTITCCRISEKLSPRQEAVARVAKKAQASSSAMTGPSGHGGARARRPSCRPVARSAVARVRPCHFLPQHSSSADLRRPCSRRRPSACRRSA